MQLEKFFTRNDGMKICIKALFTIGRFDHCPQWTINISYCPKGKRKFVDIVDTDDYSFRILDAKSRIKYISEKQAEFVTQSEILEVKTALWQSIKPT